MNTPLIAALVIAGSALAPVAVRADDGSADRAHPVAFVKDSVITTKVKSKLAADKLRSLTHVHVDTDQNGRVVLSGSVRSPAGVDAAQAIARDTEGVTSVQNNIKVRKHG